MEDHSTGSSSWVASMPTAAMVAWMWALPLLGAVATVSPAITGAGSAFPLAFLVGNILGYAILSLPGMRTRLPQLVQWGPVIGLLASISLLDTAVIPVPRYPTTVAIGAMMGIATAPVILRWAISLPDVPARHRGFHAGAMFATASAFYGALLLAKGFSPVGAYWLALLLLLYPAIKGNRTPATGAHQGNRPGSVGASAPVSRWSFWIPFFLLLLAFYSMAWMAHTLIFPATRSDSPALAIIGAVVYGGVALGVGHISDRSRGTEEIAWVGLAALFGAYGISATGTEAWSLVNLLLESSYGAIDLFAFVYLATWATLLARDSAETIGRGLSLYTGVVALGYFVSPLLAADAAALRTLPLAIAGAAALLLGNIAILLLRRARLDALGVVAEPTTRGRAPGEIPAPEEVVENITPRETDVLMLILDGQSNADIAETLGISMNTLKTHIRNLYAKAHVSNRTELVLKVNPPVNSRTG